MPKKKAQISVNGLSPKAAKPNVPATIIVTIPKTRWWTWRPLSLSMLPGHQLTSMRISRVLMRMKPKEPTKPTRTRKTPWRWWSTNWCSQKSVKMLASGSAVLIPTPPCSSRLPGGDRLRLVAQDRAAAVAVVDQVERQQDDGDGEER